MDALGITMAEEKLIAIRNLEFPCTLKQLDSYLKGTGYLCHFIPNYAQIAELLQARKTSLNRALRSKPGDNITKNKRRSTIFITMLTAPSESELCAIHTLQTCFARSTTLAHFDKTQRLYLDLDVSKENGFGTMIYHSKRNPDSSGSK